MRREDEEWLVVNKIQVCCKNSVKNIVLASVTPANSVITGLVYSLSRWRIIQNDI